MTAAVETVVASPELLTAVLLYLPTKDLLLSQRVSRFFRDLIISAPALQEALYFRAPKPHRPEAPRKNADNDDDKDNNDSDDDEQPDDETMKFVPNPLLLERFSPFYATEGAMYTEDLKQIFWTETDNRIAAITRRGASWRRMLPGLPPPKAIRTCEDPHYYDEADDITGEFIFFRWLVGANVGGCINMGQLYDLCASFILVEHPYGQFSVSWGVTGFKAPNTSQGYAVATDKPFWRLGDRQFEAMEVVHVELTYVPQCIVDESDDERGGGRDFLCEEVDKTKAIPEGSRSKMIGGQYVVAN